MDENKTNLPAATKRNTLKTNDDDRKWFSFPNSPASNTVLNAVSHAGDLETFGKRLEHNSHSTQIDFFDPPDGSKNLSQRIKYSTDNTETTIHLDNIDLFTKANKPLKKILTYTLVQLSKENVTENLENDISIKFPLEDFVSLGCYKTIRTARQAFNQSRAKRNIQYRQFWEAISNFPYFHSLYTHNFSYIHYIKMYKKNTE